MTGTTERLEDPFGVLRRVMQPRERPVPGERCDMCAEEIGEQHSHVANVADRRLLCTCRGCYLLFTARGAGGLRMRAVPEEHRRVEGLGLTQVQWDDLAVPVDLVFLFLQSEPDDQTEQSEQGGDGTTTRLVALYPSPAGATESELDEQVWVQNLPVLETVADDVQALLIRRTGPGEFTALVVPVDACYELVGLVRKHWTGFSGGTEVWTHIDEFFATLLGRAR
jgi:hypothetical protein